MKQPVFLQQKPVLFLLIILLSLGFTACGTEVQKAEERRPKTVSWIRLDRENGRINRSLSGVLRSAERAEMSFEVPGKVEAVHVELGEHFSRGDLLAELDDQVYELTVKQRAGELAEAEARLNEARNDFNRKSKLIKIDAVSRSEYDLAKAAYEAARTRVDVAEARLGLAEEDLADTGLVAPYDGTVSKRYIEPSQRVAAGQIAFEIQGNSNLEIAVSVPESVIPALTPGSVRTVRFPVNPDMEVEAGITEIGTRAESANAFPVILTLAEQYPELRAGMTAEVDFALPGSDLNGQGNTPADSLLRIPVTAFAASSGQGHYVYVYHPGDDTISRQPVTIASLSGQYGYVSEGLQPGDIIVKAGLPFLRDGQKVTLLNGDVRTYNE